MRRAPPRPPAAGRRRAGERKRTPIQEQVHALLGAAEARESDAGEPIRGCRRVPARSRAGAAADARELEGDGGGEITEVAVGGPRRRTRGPPRGRIAGEPRRRWRRAPVVERSAWHRWNEGGKVVIRFTVGDRAAWSSRYASGEFTLASRRSASPKTRLSSATSRTRRSASRSDHFQASFRPVAARPARDRRVRRAQGMITARRARNDRVDPGRAQKMLHQRRWTYGMSQASRIVTSPRIAEQGRRAGCERRCRPPGRAPMRTLGSGAPPAPSRAARPS